MQKLKQNEHMQHIEVPHELVNLKRQGKLEQGDQVIFAQNLKLWKENKVNQ